MIKLYSTLRNFVFAISTLGFLALTSTAQAVPVTLNVDGGGLLLGASGVNVNGNLFDVEFLDGSCVSLFDGCDSVGDFPFLNLADASSAAQALLDTVFIDGPLGQFDSSPQLTNGIMDPNLARFIIPYGTPTATIFYVVFAQNSTSHLIDTVLNTALVTTFNSSGFLNATYAQFKSAPLSVVPLPPAGILFGSGLVFLALLRRRAKKLAQA